MIVVDTSVWVDLFRGKNTALEGILSRGDALIHPFVQGELQLGGLPGETVGLFDWPPVRIAPVAEAEEVRLLIHETGLVGTGIGYVDAHLLASARLADGLVLTSDKRLHAQAQRLRCAYEE